MINLARKTIAFGSLAVLLNSTGALAQTTAVNNLTPAAASIDTVDEVIVTGTRQSGITVADSPTPVQVLSAESLKAASGNPALLQTLSQLIPSLQVSNGGSGDQSNNTQQARLRGLSPNHVLVLIDGKRRHTTAQFAVSGGAFAGGAGADLNFIPVDAIDHIEVLTEGAAAQYGSDAIAGVINIILKKNSSGVAVDGTYGRYGDGGGITSDVSANAGFELTTDGYLNLTVEDRNHGFSQRPGYDYRVFDPKTIGTSVGTGVNKIFPNENIADVPGYPYVNEIGGDPQSELKLISFNSGVGLGGGAEVYSFGTYGHKDTASFENYRFPSKAAYVNPATGAVSLQYPLGFNPQESNEETDYGLTAGVRGEVAHWKWDLSTSYGVDRINVYTINSSNTGLYAATGFSPTDFYDGLFKASQWTTTLDIDRDFDVGLAGPLNIGFGGEYRRDTFKIGEGSPASLSSNYGGASSYPGFTAQDAGDHSRKNYAAYIDVAATPIEGLRLDAAGRHEHYTDFGNADVGKLTGRFDFTPIFALRATASTGFRAPTLLEEYYSATNVSPGTAVVQLPPNSAAAKDLGLPGGLQPEKSTNLSLGAVFRPLPQLTATLDLYQILVTNRIFGSSSVVGTSGGTVWSEAVNDAIAANGSAGAVAGAAYSGVSTYLNGIDTRTRGADLVFDLPVDYAWGSVNWSLGATYNDTVVTRVPGTPAQVAGGIHNQVFFQADILSELQTVSPKYVVNLGGLWTLGKYSVNLHEALYGTSSLLQGDYGQTNGVTTEYYRTTLGVTPITDLDLGFQATSHLKFDLGAINLLNRYPNRVNGSYIAALTTPAAVTSYGNIGVSKYANFSPFGANGGFYYVKAAFSF